MGSFYVRLPQASVTTTPPVGGATEAKQDVGNSSLSSIDSKLTSVSGLTSTNVSGKISLDVNVTSLTLDANDDRIETRGMPMSTRLDEVSSTLSYVGEAVVGSAEGSAVWRIKRIQTTGTVLKIEWAGGVSTFSQIWTNRASLSYS